MHRSCSAAFESPSFRSCVHANRTEHFLLFFPFSLPPTSHTMLSSLPSTLVLLLCMLYLASAVSRNVSERYIILTQRLHLSITPSFLHTLAAISPPSRPSLTVHVGSQCKSMQRSRCKARARPGLSKHGDFTICLSSFLVPRISEAVPGCRVAQG